MPRYTRSQAKKDPQYGYSLPTTKKKKKTKKKTKKKKEVFYDEYKEFKEEDLNLNSGDLDYINNLLIEEYTKDLNQSPLLSI